MIWHKMRIKEVLSSLKTDASVGLDEAEAELRTSRYGKNLIDKTKRKSLAARFFAQLNDYMIIILVAAAIISYIISIAEGNPDITETIIIMAIVILNAIIGVAQENKAEKAIEALNRMSASETTVIRNGKHTKIPAEDVTVGDILVLKAGDKIPADARIIAENMLKTDESALTGESMAVEKTSNRCEGENIAVSDMNNMIWSSTLVVAGTCKAAVTDIGMSTQMGKIAGMINNGETPKTPLQEKLSHVGRVLGIGAVAICVIIFVVGVINNINMFDMFMTAVSLAVAAIPEGLPAIVTVMLAVGVRKMALKNAVVRKLPAVETLGCAGVICSDKTGTLTKNKMTVEKISGDRVNVLTLALMCSNNSDPTELAITEAGEREFIKYDAVRKMYNCIKEKPFNSNDKYMITLHRFDGRYRQVIKGAPDVIIKKCTMTFETKTKALRELDVMAGHGLRVIAVAYCDTNDMHIKNDAAYSYGGLIGISDPLRPEVKTAVEICKKAGIKPVMITGDHKATACAIAKNAGIMADGSEVLTGEEMNKLSDADLKNRINNISVFARVTPQHKVRIVEAFQANGIVTAMTGDGVNDAPALKTADIGCAMGTGTDVAKGAADIILADDNFATIVEAVKQGRIIYSNIKKTVHFLLSSNMGEIFTIFVAILMKMPSPLTAIQLLWVNLITDSLPAIALGMENNEKEVMTEKPVDRKKSMFAGGMIFNILLEGAMIAGLALFAYVYAQRNYGDIGIARTMAFCVLALSQLVHSFNMHSEKPVITGGFTRNKLLVFSFVLGCTLQLLLVTVKPLADMFGMSVLAVGQLKLIGILSIVPIIVMEFVKLFDMIFKK